CANTRLIDGVSKSICPNLISKLFSSGTQSKHHAKLITSLSRSQYAFIHWPPHGPGSKKGTTRNGRVTACCNALFSARPEHIFGSLATVVSTTKSHRFMSFFFSRSHTRQSTKNACLYCSDALSVRFETPRLLASFLRKRSCPSQRGISK